MHVLRLLCPLTVSKTAGLRERRKLNNHIIVSMTRRVTVFLFYAAIVALPEIMAPPLLNFRMSWPPRATVEDAVDETPWALLGEAPHSESHDPWQDDHNDVEPNSPTPFTPRPRPNFILYPAGPATPANPIPRRNFPPLYQTQAQAQAQAHAFHALNTGTSFLLSSPSSSSPAETINQPEVPPSHRSRLARHRCLLAARRTMDYFNDGVEYVRGTYNSTVDTASAVYNAATSKTAQRTLLTTVLFAFLSSILFGFASVGYLAFYHEYLPDQVMTMPVHLQYGYVA